MQSQHKIDAGQAPVAVDLDGTLIRTDLLWEALPRLAARSPVSLVRVLIEFAIRGKAAGKHAVANLVALQAQTLPYNQAVLNLVRREYASGRQVWLVTGAPEKFAEQVSAHLGCFTGVLASSPAQSLTGSAKAQALEARFGRGGFDYIGDSRADLPVWRAARGALIVGESKSLLKAAIAENPAATQLTPPTQRFASIAHALRTRQWPKNLLLAVPLLAAHQAGNVQGWISLAIAFVIFCASASAIYIANDLADVEHDRLHPRKRLRPFAAGLVHPATGVMLASALLVAAAILALALPWAFAAVLAGYVLLASAYSLWLKRVLLLDVFVLASLYLLRVVAGAMAVGVPVSYWLLAFSTFFFLSLALLKRYAELVLSDGGNTLPGRGYRSADQPMVLALGIGCGLVSVLVFALYFSSTGALALYRNPQFLWLALPPLLYWIARLWFLAGRGELIDDPVAFALRDKVSYTVLLLIVAAIAAAAL